MRNLFLFMLACLLSSSPLIASVNIPSDSVTFPDNSVILKGTITDKRTGEPVSFAGVLLFQKGKQIRATYTHLDGVYSLCGITPLGVYDIEVLIMGYKPLKISDIFIETTDIFVKDLQMEEKLYIME